MYRETDKHNSFDPVTKLEEMKLSDEIGGVEQKRFKD